MNQRSTFPADEAPPVRILTASEFTDRVMVAVAATPAPTPTRSFLAALRRGTPRNAARSLSVASHLVTVRAWPVAPRVRARSFALVLGVAFVLGTGSVAAAAAVRQIVPLKPAAPAVIVHERSDVVRPPAPVPTAEPRPVEIPGHAAAARPATTSPTSHPARRQRDPAGSAGSGRATDAGRDGSDGDADDDREDDGDHDAGPSHSSDDGEDRSDDGGSHGGDGGTDHDDSGDSGG